MCIRDSVRAAQIGVLIAPVGQGLLHGVRVDGGLGGLLQNVDHSLRGVLGNSEAAPALDGDVDAQFLGGGHVGNHRGAALAQDARCVEETDP